VQANFNLSKYRTKKPILSNNTYVSFEGFLEDIETDSAGRVTVFHISVDNISFLSRAALLPSTGGSLGEHFYKIRQSTLGITPLAQDPPLPPNPRVSNLILMPHLQAHPPKLQSQVLPPLTRPPQHDPKQELRHGQENAGSRNIIEIL